MNQLPFNNHAVCADSCKWAGWYFKRFSQDLSFCSLCVSSYLHCEWATEQQLEKDKRIQQKIKRFKMKQAQRALLFADVRQFSCQWTFFIGIFKKQLIILCEHGVFMICLRMHLQTCKRINIFTFIFCLLPVWAGTSVCIYLNFFLL